MYLLSHFRPNFVILNISISPAIRIQEERVMHEAKLAKMEAEMKMVFQQKVQEKEAKLKQSEEELYARHREMKEALEKQRLDLEDKKRRIESGRPLTPEKQTVSLQRCCDMSSILTRCHHYSRKGVGSTFEDNFRPSSFSCNLQYLFFALLSSSYGHGHIGCPQRRSLFTLLFSCRKTLPYNSLCAFEHSPRSFDGYRIASAYFPPFILVSLAWFS